MSQRRRALIRSFCSAVATVFIALALLPVTALADSPYQLPTVKLGKLKGPITLYIPGKDLSPYYDVTCKKGKLTKAKSSNPEVVDVYPWGEGWKDATGMSIYGLKKGKATVTYTYKGKTHKVKVVVKKYPKPIKKLKIGKTNYARKLKSMAYAFPKWNACKGKKLSLTPAKGWDVKSIKFSYYSADWEKYYTKKVRNGGKLPKVTNAESLIITLKNKKNGGYVTVMLTF